MKCWEFHECKSKKGCPAYPDFGRLCYGITGTLCFGNKQGTHKEKKEVCRECDFYLKKVD